MPSALDSSYRTDPAKADFIVTASGLEEALNRLKSQGLSKPVHRAFIIGGAQLYRETLKLPKGPYPPAPSTHEAYVDRILLTRVFSPEFECDTFMPEFKVDSELGGAGKEEVDGWKQSTCAALKEWAGVDVAEGAQEENGCRYEFQMFTRE
jgi:dihydrofolate reductase